ncbi:MAG TPA: hypothetical protein VLF20_01555, partial [Patescibacteria group bacterium]|nr:hypothetical protein [Patescibacteria group bacterium]
MNKQNSSDIKKIPKNPFLFGLFATKPYKKFAVSAMIASFIATGVGRYTVVPFAKLTDAIAANPIDIQAIWFWAITYVVLVFINENFIWRSSGFAGMRWFTGAAYYMYQSLYEYLSLHSREY